MFIESENLELKSQITGDICKEIIAFANSKGGKLYIGIEDNGQVIGVKNSDKSILQLNNMIRNSIKPDVTMFVHYETQYMEDKKVILLTVQKGTDRPYYLKNKGIKPAGVYVRNGTSSEPATDTAIRKMIKETDGDSFETMRALDQNLTFKAAEKQFNNQNMTFTPSNMQTLKIISQDGIYSNLAMLLSDQCRHSIKAAVFSGSDKEIFQDRKEFNGSLFQQMEDAYTYLNIHNQTKATFEGLYRKDIRSYPEEALRETLMNALVHRDYSYSAGTLISIYDDRIEFVSIGGIPSGLFLEDIMLGLSVCRNPNLAAIFYRLQLIEAYGTGMPKIMNAYSDSNLKPNIEVTANAFKITLPNRNISVNNNVDNSPDIDTFASHEDKILNLIASCGYVVRNDIDELLNVSQATSNRILKQMITSGLIRQSGKGKATKYLLNKNTL